MVSLKLSIIKNNLLNSSTYTSIDIKTIPIVFNATLDKIKAIQNQIDSATDDMQYNAKLTPITNLIFHTRIFTALCKLKEFKSCAPTSDPSNKIKEYSQECESTISRIVDLQDPIKTITKKLIDCFSQSLNQTQVKIDFYQYYYQKQKELKIIQKQNNPNKLIQDLATENLEHEIELEYKCCDNYPNDFIQ